MAWKHLNLFWHMADLNFNHGDERSILSNRAITTCCVTAVVYIGHTYYKLYYGMAIYAALF